jgi:hypothetical protein
LAEYRDKQVKMKNFPADLAFGDRLADVFTKRTLPLARSFPAAVLGPVPGLAFMRLGSICRFDDINPSLQRMQRSEHGMQDLNLKEQ